MDSNLYHRIKIASDSIEHIEVVINPDTYLEVFFTYVVNILRNWVNKITQGIKINKSCYILYCIQMLKCYTKH